MSDASAVSSKAERNKALADERRCNKAARDARRETFVSGFATEALVKNLNRKGHNCKVGDGKSIMAALFESAMSSTAPEPEPVMPASLRPATSGPVFHEFPKMVHNVRCEKREEELWVLAHPEVWVLAHPEPEGWGAQVERAMATQAAERRQKETEAQLAHARMMGLVVK